MANLYSDNLNSGTGPKGNLGDFQHAARLFLANNYKLAPKNKFLYHVYFSINRDVAAINPGLIQKYSTEIGMLVKSADLPKYTAQIETKNKYNRKKHVQTNIQYQSINVTLHDDNYGITTAILEAYYRWYFADGWHSETPGAFSKNPSDNTFLGNARNQYRYGLDNALSTPFFKNIQISQLSRNQYTTYTLVNPIISSWGHDTVDAEDGATPMSNNMTIEYEAVHYSRGTIDGESPLGFGNEHYDNVSSPLDVVTTAQTQPASDLAINRQSNVSNNSFRPSATNISSDSARGNIFNSNYSINVQPFTGLSGLQNVTIPRNSGTGGVNDVTLASLNVNQSSSTKPASRDELINNPAKLESEAKLLHRSEFLNDGGDGINAANNAWNNLSVSVQNSYKEQVLDQAI